jgi:cystathionine gamma-lyase
LESCLAALENGKHGLVFSSGLGATTALMSLLESGDHVVCGDDVYGGTNRFFQRCVSKQNIQVSFVDACNTENFVAAVKGNTKVNLLGPSPLSFSLSIFFILSILLFHLYLCELSFF